MIQHSKSMQKRRVKTQFQTKKKSMLSISMACLAWIRKQGHFTAGQPRNP